MNADRLHRQKLRNLLQTILLLGAMALLCGYLAWLVGGDLAMWLALGLLLAGYQFNPQLSPWLVLRLYGGQLLDPASAPRLHAVLEVVAERAGLPRTPRLCYIPSNVMNAFATGSADNSVVALSDGLLRRLDLREISGVLAHEVSHIRSDDLRVMGFGDLVTRLVSLLSLLGQLLLLFSLPLLLFSDYAINWLPILLLLAAPTLSALAQLALSRNREYDADLGAAELTGDPEGLASALRKMEIYQGRVLEQILFPGQRLPDPSLLRTHPPTSERINRLLELREQPAWLAYRHSPFDTAFTDYQGGFVSRHPLIPRWHRSGLWY